MVLRVGERERLGRSGDEADQPFAGQHRRQVNSFAIKPFGGEQLERAVGVRHIERAYLGDHVGGDENDNAVEARLRRDRLRHDLAEPSQQ